jgi:hypothetical protein
MQALDNEDKFIHNSTHPHCQNKASEGLLLVRMDFGSHRLGNLSQGLLNLKVALGPDLGCKHHQETATHSTLTLLIRFAGDDNQ